MTHLDDEWDAVVVGAGVAGGCIAALLADRGWRVLLVERSVWPRETVCGGCLSAVALNTLREMGMQSAVADATPTNKVIWRSGSRSFEHRIPQGAAVLRVHLDAGIVAEAQCRGAHFMPDCTARLMPASAGDSFRSLRLQTKGQTIQIRAHLVIACDGIAGTLLKDEPWAAWSIASSAFIGVAATYQCSSDETSFGYVLMSMGRSGYVGQVRIDDSTVHLAAALDPGACRHSGGPLNLIGDILRSCCQSVPAALGAARLHGTGKLTRHRKQLGGHRVLSVGDACGYVEPVTGEGMSWAAMGALELNRILPPSPLEWSNFFPKIWTDRYLNVIGRQQRWCRGIRTTIRHPATAAAGMIMGNAFPGLARWIAQAICEPKKDVMHDQIGHVPRAQVSQRIETDDPGHRHGEPAGSSPGVIA